MPFFPPLLLLLLPCQTKPSIASEFPGDQNIVKHPAVLFHDDFEKGNPGDNWDEVSLRLARGATNRARPLTLETDPAIVRGQKTAKAQLRKDGHEDITLTKRLKPGHDELHMRYYIRYGADYGYHSHGGGGFMADAGKGNFKGAGKPPDGDKFFWATLEPIGPRDWPPPGALIFYAYWWKMKPDGRGNHWGNWFQPTPDQIPARETWTCLEWRVKANQAGKENGELDCWVDGRHCGQFRGINWRSTDSLQVNKVLLSLWLEPATYARSGGGETRTVWYDDIVVATRYIGPMKIK